MSDPSLAKILHFIGDVNLCKLESIRQITPLEGGVSSEIYLIVTQRQKFCIKFARAHLMVAQNWDAPIERNLAEFRWLNFVQNTLPKNGLKLYGISENLNGFAMEYIEGQDVSLWKEQLLMGEVTLDHAIAMGNLLANIHSLSTKDIFNANDFQNQHMFHALRIEPYLLATSTKHPELKGEILRIISTLNKNKIALIHGDVSPKNILFRGAQPILIDAECATMGDPCFDVAFLLNHLLIKAIHMPEYSQKLCELSRVFWSQYKINIDWEDMDKLDLRTSALVPALMLARIDGKSPVEYLDQAQRNKIRKLACDAIKSPPQGIDKFIADIEGNAKGSPP